MKFSVSLVNAEHRPGDVVRGTVSASAGGSCREVTVRLAYREKAPAMTAWARELEPVVIAGGEIPPGSSWDFSLRLPDDALPAYRSRHGELDWYVVTEIDRRGVDRSHAARVKVSPTPA